MQELDLDLVNEEFPPAPDCSIYLNTGSCGRKPRAVLAAIEDGWRKLNLNPTRFTFVDSEPSDLARQSAADLLGLPPDNLLLTQSTTQGLQLIMQSFLSKPGDELVTTNHEHGAVKTIARFLAETRGVIVRQVEMDPLQGSRALCSALLSHVNEKTSLVQVSEIDCYSGWRPDLTMLVAELEEIGVPLLVDGAHTPGQAPCRPARYPLWVGSGHKWLGAPNGTGFAYVAPHLVQEIKPVTVGDKFYECSPDKLARFECQGTPDLIRLSGLAAACRLHLRFDAEKVAERQRRLVEYLRESIAPIPEADIRTPDITGESSGMLTVTWSPERVTVPDLRNALWQEHKIWIQPDFLYGQEGHGMRISCHVATTEGELDKLAAAVSRLVS